MCDINASKLKRQQSSRAQYLPASCASVLYLDPLKQTLGPQLPTFLSTKSFLLSDQHYNELHKDVILPTLKTAHL